MNNVSNCKIDRTLSGRGYHNIEYYIYASMVDVKNNVDRQQDPDLYNLLEAMGWDTDDYDFMYPIVRIYNILDGEGKPIDESYIRDDMKTFCLFINNQFKEANYPDMPIYFTTVQYMKSILSSYNEQAKKYNDAFVYECMQFELSGFFNIMNLVKSNKAVSFVYGNKSAQQIYLELIAKSLI